MPEIKDRLLKFLKHLDIGQTKFETITQLSNGLINNLKDNISSKSLIKILEVYPELNMNWLLIEDGDMLKSSDNVLHEIDVGAKYQLESDNKHLKKQIQNLEKIISLLEEKVEELKNGNQPPMQRQSAV